MAKAKKLPSGNYRTRVHVGGGKYKSFTAPTKKESEFLASEYLMRFTSDIDGYVPDLVRSYINSKRESLSPSSIRSYEIIHRNQIQLLNGIKVSKFNQRVHQKWIDDISKNLSAKSVKNCNGLLVSALCYYDVNVLPVKLPQKQYKPIIVPTTDQVRQIIQYFEQNGNFKMVRACYLASTGTLRRGEICALTADDIDRENNTVTVNKSIVQTPDRKEVIKEPKTYSSNRTIELPKFVIDLLPEEGRIVDLSLGMLTHDFNYAKTKLGFNFNFHSLRHYAASIMHANNIPTQYIMERGGWKSERTLIRIYRNTMDDYRKKFTDKTNAFYDENLK